MRQVLAPAILHQQTPADRIWETRTLIEVIVFGHRAGWSETPDPILVSLKYSGYPAALPPDAPPSEVVPSGLPPRALCR